jgi:hypothetical protein
MSRKQLLTALTILVASHFLLGCAAGPNFEKGVPTDDGSLAGFWLGLWQGLIVPVTFFVSLFSSRVNIYEIHNSGGLYNFGFLLGSVFFWGSLLFESGGRSSE